MNSTYIRQLIHQFQHRLPTFLQHTNAIIPKIPTAVPKSSAKILQNAANQPIRYYYTRSLLVRRCKATPPPPKFPSTSTIISASLLTFLVGKDPEGEETPEDKLVMAIKRSILCIQREQYDKAEQMLHLALRMAQDLRSKDGITYVYDVMANLAMERAQYQKAEKLFVNVMQRLLQDGHPENDIKMLHISSKIAHMHSLQLDFAKAEQGFVWTLGEIEKQTERLRTDDDLQELMGLTKDWLVSGGFFS